MSMESVRGARTRVRRVRGCCAVKVAVLGLGYVGTVTAAGLASVGHDVVGVDVDPVKVELVGSGHSPVVEPGIDEMLSGAVASGRLTATTDTRAAVDGADVSLVCVGTPSSPDGGTDLGYLRRAVQGLRSAMADADPPTSGHHVVVVRSTVPPGTVDEYVAAAFADGRAPDGWSVGAAMCPEFLREGSGVEDFFHPPFVVIGTARRADRRRAPWALHVPRPRAARRRHTQRRGAEVRVQRLPRDEGVLHERDGPDLPGARGGRARGHGASSARTRSSTSPRPTCGRASPSAAPACRRTCARCSTWRG